MKIWCVDAVAAGHATSQKRPKLGLTFFFLWTRNFLSSHGVRLKSKLTRRMRSRWRLSIAAPQTEDPGKYRSTVGDGEYWKLYTQGSRPMFYTGWFNFSTYYWNDFTKE